MKQWIILIVCIILLLLTGMWQICYLEKTARYTLSDIEYVKNSAINENFDMAKEGIENVEKTWNSVKTVWHMFVDSSEVDKVEEHITQIKSYIDEEDKEEVIVNANELDRILYCKKTASKNWKCIITIKNSEKLFFRSFF